MQASFHLSLSKPKPPGHEAPVHSCQHYTYVTKPVLEPYPLFESRIPESYKHGRSLNEDKQMIFSETRAAKLIYK